MRKTLSVLVVLLHVLPAPVHAGQNAVQAGLDAEGELHREWVGRIDAMNTISRLTDQVAAATIPPSQWVVVSNSPEKGFNAGVINQADNTVLIMLCQPPDEDREEELRGILIYLER